TELKDDIHKLDKRMEAGFSDTDRKISDTKAELNKSISDTKTELKDDIHKLDKRMEAGFSDTDRKISDTKTELKGDIQKLDKKMEAGFSDTKDELKDGIYKSERTILLIVVSTLVSLVVGFVTGVFGGGAK
ncbi:MAG: hypothetical protein OXU34_03785, partial [Gammaproteobacteria bacterium]|nr:hypothetical protein [Gammaproteobacteria bacterium]